jgi:uncharacterized protein with PQ loop repeat
MIEDSSGSIWAGTYIMIEIIGYIGTFALMFCNMPLWLKTLHDGHCKGVSIGYLILSEFGFLCMMVYIQATSFSIPLLINYVVNIFFVGTMILFKFFPRTI